jgi:hypothetical protein
MGKTSSSSDSSSSSMSDSLRSGIEGMVGVTEELRTSLDPPLKMLMSSEMDRVNEVGSSKLGI